jgi:molybdopterin molybdotransferase
MNIFEVPSSYNEADSYTFINIKPVMRIEAVNLEDSLNRVLAEDFTAVKNIPAFSRATMDGYAVMAKDTAGVSQDNPKISEIIDYLYAGGVSKKYLSCGECIQITTGAKIPGGADAVVMTENTGIENGRLCIYKPVNYGENIEVEGEDVKKGHIILKAGAFLTPARIGILAAQGIQQVKVYEKPKVAIISNGEELTELNGILKDGQIYDINSFTVSAIVKENGCLPIKFGIVGDNPQQIKSIIEEALKVADFVFISGGSSHGEKDFLYEILQKFGKIPSYKIKAGEGKSGIFVIAGGKPILGTPGFPSSCLINAYVLLMPALRKIASLPFNREIVINAKLGETVETAGVVSGRFLPVRIEGNKAMPVIYGRKGITGIAKADGYVLLNEEATVLEEGMTVAVNLF